MSDSSPVSSEIITDATHLAQTSDFKNPRCRRKNGQAGVLILSLAAMVTLLLCAGGAHAANLFWDPGITNNGATIDPASGSWSTVATTLNWNNGSGNVNWMQTSTTAGTMGAIFNGTIAAPGTYQVAVDGGQVAGTNFVVNASGYLFTGSPIYLNTGPLTSLMVSNGVSVIFSNNLGGFALAGNNANTEIRAGDVGPASTVTIYGAIGNTGGWQPHFESTNGSIFYLANSIATASAASTVHVDADVRMTKCASSARYDTAELGTQRFDQEREPHQRNPKPFYCSHFSEVLSQSPQ